MVLKTSNKRYFYKPQKYLNVLGMMTMRDSSIRWLRKAKYGLQVCSFDYSYLFLFSII